MTLPEGLRGRLLAAALTLSVVCAAWFAVAAPLIALYHEGSEELAQRRVLLQHMQEAAATLPELERDRVTGVRPATMTVLPGGTDAMAAAAMQSNVQAMAVAAGISLASMETLPAEAQGAYRRIGLRVAATAPWPVLIEFLRAASRGRPRMLIDDLVLHAQPEPNHAAAVPIIASFTLLAFRSASAGEPP
ncbi:MAG TPA: type II secretion system protein GspM [Acetobacteraceae bacterium]|nr:type II secretion system protein GspM [Acetobacteraceae bacterium]